MKIVIVGTAYPLRGGIAHYIELLHRHLSKRHDVEIVTFSRQYPQWLYPGKSQMEEGKAANHILTHPLIDSLNPLTWIRAARFIAQKNPDLVIFKYWLPFFGPCFGTIARLVKRKSKAKVAIICDNVIPHERRPGDIAFTRYFFRSADAFIVQSRAVERQLSEFRPGARSRFVPHPIYENFGNVMPVAEARKRLDLMNERVILFFGYIRAYKGLDLLLEAMPRIVSEIPLTLLVVGEFYEGAGRYEKLIKEGGIETSVRLVGTYVPNEEVSLYFSACDVVVLPYRSATQSGIVQIAYQFDRPVIATDVGGLSEVVLHQKTGIIVPPGDPTALSAAVIEFYRSNLGPRFADQVRKEKAKYTWEALVEALESTLPKAGEEQTKR